MSYRTSIANQDKSMSGLKVSMDRLTLVRGNATGNFKLKQYSFTIPKILGSLKIFLNTLPVLYK